MSTLQTAARVALGGLALAELLAASTRFQARKDLFMAAQRRATETGRRLVVVGDPDAGMHTRLLPAYGCGDVCVDLNACPRCPTSEAVDLTKGRTSVPDDSAVVYVSCVLEYVPDFPSALREIERMAGSRENLFNVAVQPWTLTSTLYPGAHNAVSERSPGQLEAAPVTTARKVATVASLLALGYVAMRRETRDNPGRRRSPRRPR